MSSGLVDAAVLAPLKPVPMAGDPHEDTPVFEDIKAPSRPLENAPDLAQVSLGKGPLPPAQVHGASRKTPGFGLNSALFSPSLLRHLRGFVGSRFPLRWVFSLGVLGFVRSFGLVFFLVVCLLSAFQALRGPCGLCSHSRVQSLFPGLAGEGVSRALPLGKILGLGSLCLRVLDGKRGLIFHFI